MLASLHFNLLLLLGLGLPLAMAQILANGTSLTTGIIDASVRWQSSGVLQVDSCQPNVAFPNCYRMALGATGNLAEADRQRIECLSWPPSMGGETWVYDWNYYLVPGASSSDHFFHLSQLLSRDIGGYVIALDLREGRVRILDTIRPTCGGTCPSVAANAFWGRTTYHRMTVTYGEGGRLRYTVRAPAFLGGPQTQLFDYRIPVGTYIPPDSTIKTGLYRYFLNGQTAATAYVGNFNFRRTA